MYAEQMEVRRREIGEGGSAGGLTEVERWYHFPSEDEREEQYAFSVMAPIEIVKQGREALLPDLKLNLGGMDRMRPAGVV